MKLKKLIKKIEKNLITSEIISNYEKLWITKFPSSQELIINVENKKGTETYVKFNGEKVRYNRYLLKTNYEMFEKPIKKISKIRKEDLKKIKKQIKKIRKEGF